ncbi:hypothetical protein [Devosia sp. CAU 1758]
MPKKRIEEDLQPPVSERHVKKGQRAVALARRSVPTPQRKTTPPRVKAALMAISGCLKDSGTRKFSKTTFAEAHRIASTLVEDFPYPDFSPQEKVSILYGALKKADFSRVDAHFDLLVGANTKPNTNFYLQFSEAIWSYLREIGVGRFPRPPKEPVKDQPDKTLAYRQLPDSPPRYWPKRPKGAAGQGVAESLIEFLRDVYGPYFPHCRTNMRSYLRRNDPSLYQAINDFERRNSLPAELYMPTRPDRVRERLQRAVEGGYDELTPVEKHSVRRKLQRMDQKP